MSQISKLTGMTATSPFRSVAGAAQAGAGACRSTWVRMSRLIVLAALAAGLGTVSGPAVSAAAAARVRFVACPRGVADPGSTNLQPVTVPADEPAGVTYDLAPYATQVKLEHVMRLVLPDGLLGSGAGYDAALGQPERGEQGLARVADGPVTVDVTLAVADSPETGRRVAFVELRLAPTPPMTWTEETKLEIGTDGGDGGFFSSAAAQSSTPDDVDDYVDTFYPDKHSDSGIVCVLRRNDDQAEPSGFLFSTGFGDGGYPTLLGRDATGEVVSVVSYGLIVPWRLSGLPGIPPSAVTAEAARRLATPDPTEPPGTDASEAAAPTEPPAQRIPGWVAVVVALALALVATMYGPVHRWFALRR